MESQCIIHYCSRVYTCLKAHWQVSKPKSEAAIIVKKSYVGGNILCGLCESDPKKLMEILFWRKTWMQQFSILITMKQTPNIQNSEIYQMVATAKGKYRKVRTKMLRRTCNL